VRAFTVGKGQEVLSTLQAAVARAGIRHASVTLIGAVASATVSVMKKDDASTDYLRVYDQPLELSGTGEVVDGNLHAHVTLYGEDLVTGGHLHRAVVETFFVNAYVTEVSTT
jgi:predicted DNA-binding protein with PD1-like motif